MSQKSGKKKSKKGSKSEAAPSVLGNLPATRASRLGGARETAPASRTKAASAPRTKAAGRTKAAAGPKASADATTTVGVY